MSSKDNINKIKSDIRDEIKEKGVVKVVEEYGQIEKIATYGDGGGRLADTDEKDNK